MAVATISSKGQITLPAEARRAIGVAAGDRVLVRAVDGVIVVEPVVDFLSLRGVLGAALPREAEVARMQDAAADAVLTSE
jgi:AbrB family looped-hinge helix DNA binding protein